jgi:hypothetical protein
MSYQTRRIQESKERKKARLKASMSEEEFRDLVFYCHRTKQIAITENNQRKINRLVEHFNENYASLFYGYGQRIPRFNEKTFTQDSIILMGVQLLEHFFKLLDVDEERRLAQKYPEYWNVAELMGKVKEMKEMLGSTKKKEASNKTW